MKQFLLHLVWFVCLISVTAEKTISELNEIEASKILFSEKEEPTLEPEVADLYLQRLEEIYSSTPEQNVASSENRNSVLELAKLKNHQICFDPDYYMMYNAMRGRHRNTVELAKYYKELYVWRCKRPNIVAFYKNVPTVPDCNMNQLTKLRDEVESATKCLSGSGFANLKPFYSRDALLQGVYNYLINRSPELKAKAENNKENGLTYKEYESLYRPIIREVCGRTKGVEVGKKLQIDKVPGKWKFNLEYQRLPEHCISESFKVLSEYYIDQINREGLMKEFDESTRDWFKIASICIDVTTEENDIIDKVWDLVKFKHQKSKGFFDLLCIHDK